MTSSFYSIRTDDLQGAQEVFRELPFEYIDPKALPQVAQHGGKSYLSMIINILSRFHFQSNQ